MSQPGAQLDDRSTSERVLASPAEVAPRRCFNCGETVTQVFCPRCGQRATDPDPTLHEMLEELAGEFLHWDGKLLATVKTLVRRPGALTVEYLAGRRASYISPLRLYLSASVLYFFVSAVAPQDPRARDVVQFKVSDTARANPRRSNDSVAATSSTLALDTTVVPNEGLGARAAHRVNRGVSRAVKDPAAFSARIKDHLGSVVFLILPAFAFAVGLAYRKQRRHYPQHLVFALHVHAVVFVGFALIELLRFAPRSTVGTSIQIVAMAAILTYIVVALRAVYGETMGRTIAKALTLGVVYFGFFALGMGALVVYGFLTM